MNFIFFLCIIIILIFFSTWYLLHKAMRIPSDPSIETRSNINKPKVLWKADTTHKIFKEEPEEFKKHVLGFLDKYAA